VQKPHPPIHVDGAFPYDARRVIRYVATVGFQRPVAMSPRSCRIRPAPFGVPVPPRRADLGAGLGVPGYTPVKNSRGGSSAVTTAQARQG
jgi:hypothetical protein